MIRSAITTISVLSVLAMTCLSASQVIASPLKVSNPEKLPYWTAVSENCPFSSGNTGTRTSLHPILTQPLGYFLQNREGEY